MAAGISIERPFTMSIAHGGLTRRAEAPDYWPWNSLPRLAQSSYFSVNDRRLHYGLGKAAAADLDIRWPNGKQEKIANVAADQLVVVREGSGIVRTDRFRKLQP
jgi:hypothetical protein